MLERLDVGRPARVIGADGRPLTLGGLPSRDGTRWNKRRKAEVVAAVRGGLISFEEAVRRYSLAPGEFIAWERALLADLAKRRRSVGQQEFRLLRRQANAAAWKRVQAG